MATTITAGNGTNGGANIGSDTTGILEIRTGTTSGAGTTAITVDTSQNVGIGTSSPNANSKLDVAGISQSSSASFPVFQLYNSGLASNAYFRIAYDAANNLVFNNVNNAYTSSTEFMRINSSGNVGIGTSSPVSRLHVQTDAAEISRFASSAANGGLFTLLFDNSTPCYMGSQRAIVATGNASDFAIINTGANNMVFGTNSAERFRIDSGGRVTTPSQPFFLGSPTNDYSGGGMPAGFIPFTVIHNNGSCYNAGNSRFTAPVSGWYQTTWGGLQLAATVTSLSRNGVRLYNGNHFPSGVAYITMTQTAVVFLNANDYLNIEGWNGGGYYRDWYLWSVSLIG